MARDVEEVSAGNGRAQSSVPTFLERRKYKTAEAQQATKNTSLDRWKQALSLNQVNSCFDLCVITIAFYGPL